ncbi:MAG: hypothetical protein IKJ38_04245 [Alistipes sp.]|nr:hypothetical protein [Alistipes sp.]
MRKLLSIFSIALVAAFALGCENESEKGGDSRTLNFGEPTATSTTIEVGIVPSDTAASYFAGIVEASKIADKNDAAIITEYIQKLTIYNGVQFLNAENLTPETDYVAIAFYMGDTDKVTKLNIRTTAPGEVEEEFSVRITVDAITSDSAIAKAVPNDNDVNYYFRVLTQLELREMGIFENDREIFNYIIENPYSNDYIGKGERTLECTNLSPKFEYIAIAFNSDTYEDVVTGAAELNLFRYEFTTEDAPEVDPNTLFTYKNLEVGHTDFSLDVTPVKGDDKLWAYYIFEKSNYDEYIAGSRHQVVMRAYYGLFNLCNEYNIINKTEHTFNYFMNELMGQKGATKIINYEPLKPNKQYVVAMFYIDPEISDPTTVYDYNFVAVNFTTKAPDENLKASLNVVGPEITKEGFNYNIVFNIKTDDNAAILRYGADQWDELTEQYYDPNDCGSIRNFVQFRTASDEILAQAKTSEGTTISFSQTEPFDGIFLFEVENVQGALTQYMVRVTPDMFEE